MLKIENNESQYECIWSQNPVSGDWICSILTRESYLAQVAIAESICLELDKDQALM